MGTCWRAPWTALHETKWQVAGKTVFEQLEQAQRQPTAPAIASVALFRVVVPRS